MFDPYDTSTAQTSDMSPTHVDPEHNKVKQTAMHALKSKK